MRNFPNKAAPAILYHMSPHTDLHVKGLHPGQKPTASRRPMDEVYLGTMHYLKTQYMTYCRRGSYMLYEVNVEGLELDGRLPGEQWCTQQGISPERIKSVGTVRV